MHTGYFTSWPPRIDTLDSLGDLHQPRMSPSLANSQKKKSSSASAPSSPRAGPSFFSSRSQSATAVDASLPSSPTPQRTATAPTPHRRTSDSRMSARALSAGSISTDALGFRNAIAGGMLTSPSGVPTTNYLPTFFSSTPSTPFEHPSSASPRTATGSASGGPVEVTGGSAHLISFGAPYGLYRTSSGGRPPMVRSNSSKKREAQQRPSYHPFGSMKSSYSPRMAPFSDPEGASSGTGTGTGTANRHGGGFSTEFNNAGQWFQPSNLRKSVSAGKPAKKGLKSRLRKLRHRQGSTSREGPIAFTSGESDSEAAFEKEPETIFNSGGIAQRYSSFRVKQPSTSTDPSLPPPPPHPFVGPTKHSPLSNTSTEPTPTGMESHKEPSHMRFKDLFKGVGVGLSNQHSPSSGNRGMPGFPTLDHRGSHKNSKSLQAGTSFREFLSGDDQPSHNNALRMGKRRRRLTKKSHSLANGMLRPAVTDDEDSSTPKSVGGGLLNLTMREGGSRHGGHKHHTFLSTFQPRRRSRSTGEEGRRELQSVWMPDTAATPSSVPSPALRNARLEHKNNPNVLVTELPPLPESFVREFKALAPVSKSHGPPPHHSQTPSTPSVSHITPSSTAGSGMSTSTAPVPQFYGSQNHVKLQQHQVLIHQLQHQQQLHHQLHQQLQQQNHATTKAAIAAFVSKTFLFESLQNSKFQGYYIFRVVGDHVEYKKLPMGLNTLCGQYFRDTYVTYRGLEAKTKALREERERSLKFGSIWNASSQPPTDPGLQHGVSEPMVTTLGKFATVDGSSGAMSRTTATREDPGWHSASEERSGDILRSVVAWDAASPHHGALARPLSSPHKRSTGYLEQRYNPEGTLNNALVKSIIGVPDRTSNKLEPLLVKLEKSGLRLEKGGLHRSGTKNASFSGPLSAGGHFYNGSNVYSGDLASPKAVAGRPMAFIPQRPSLHHHRKRSWTGTKEQQRIEMERRRLEEEERWNKAEQKHREEVYQTTYGPQLFLNEVVHEFEYERFDASAVVTILNDNPDTAVFSIINGDKTNVMRLESPHAKLKNEFLNRLAISRMDHGECDAKRKGCVEAQRERSSFDQFMKMGQDHHYDLDDTNEEVDTLLEIVDLRIALQEENLRCVRESIQETMKEIEESLDSLDHLNDKAKKLMTDMIRAIDSQEVQLALRPSMATGLTLAETVEWKLKDVNERIVICTRIMLAAKDNLNRLKYEIELEQRSIRLFRQYKIVIAVISFSVVFLVWSLYHSRASAMAPQPASPLFSSAVNPFEVDHMFHHGEPPILPSPTSIPNFADVGDHGLGEEACPISLSMEYLEL
ncbi:hypothetical protein EMPS_10088 [Entomortierella parvispora]|uniref:Uncharacterized protein n=1 Tax=Entomortierella parvispora TaxID=205924 RepID=A0A9P3HJ91_9FUNG|nr:hypothetical protein EMPS_10088 [Entomortierella parvispora]